VGEDGKTLRDTLEVVRKMTGRMPEEGVNPVEFPEQMTEVWGWFLGISGRRRRGGFGPELVAWESMESYFRLMRITPEPWQISVIDRLDRVWFESQQEKD
jgi:hypothetical protein